MTSMEHLVEPSATMLVSLQGYSCLAAVVVLIWDWFDTLTAEIHYIWKPPMNQQRLTYLFSRYFGISFQVANVFFTVTSGIGALNLPVPHHVCTKWLVMQAGSFLVLYAIGNANLMIQAYMLHRGSMKVLALLSALTIAEYTSAIIGIKRRVDTIVFDNKCDRLNTYRGTLVLIVFIIFKQCTTWSLILEKFILGRAPMPLRTILFRGGQWTWFLGVGLLAIIIPIVKHSKNAQPNFFLSWPTSLISIGTCRLILSYEKLRGARQQDRLSRMQWRSSRMQHASAHFNSTPSNNISAPSVDSRSSSQPPANDNDHPTSINSLYSSDHDIEDSNSSVTSRNLTDGQWSTDDSAIDVGSQHTSSSLTSEEIREYWNGVYNPFPLRRL